MTDLPTVRISCVAEARPHWVAMVENLAVTLRNYGGSLATAPMRACFVGQPAGSPVLDALDVECTVVEPYPASAKPTNKLRMFQAFVDKPDADVLLALDCDLVVVGDLIRDLPTDRVGMMPAVTSPLTTSEWADVLQALDLPVGLHTTTMHATGVVVPAPYFNSGVMSVPASLCGALLEAWEHYVSIVDGWMRSPADGPASLPQWAPTWQWTVDQVALSAALLATGVEVEPLDPGLNLTTGQPWRHVESRFAEYPVKLVHYHRRLNSAGLLLPTDSRVVNAVIDDVNRLIEARIPRPKPGRFAEVARRATGRAPRDFR